jgi:hypothetical protein
MQSGEELEICALIIRVFSEFIAHQYSDRDIQGFLRYLQPRSLSKRFKEDSFVWVAATQEKIAFSMIDSEIENNNPFRSHETRDFEQRGHIVSTIMMPKQTSNHFKLM